MIKGFSYLITFVLVTVSLELPAFGAAKDGATCLKLGSTSVVNGKKFTCVKSGAKLTWKKRVAPSVSSTNSSVTSSTRTFIPDKLQVVLQFSENVKNKSMWMTSYYLHCTSLQTLPQGQYEFQQRLVEQMNWSQTPVMIYNGKGELIGIPDSIPSVVVASDGSCSLTFNFSYLKFEISPLIMKSGTKAYWTIPFSDWKDGSIHLNADFADFRAV